MQPSQPDESAPDVVESPPAASRGFGRSRRGAVAGLLTVALLAAGATGVALAADKGTATPTPSGPGSSAAPGPRGEGDRPGPGGMMGRMHRGGGGLGLGLGGMMGAVHGEVVVPKTGGGYETVLMQRGTVTAVSAGSLSVKSEDGFAATYDVTKATVVHAASDGITSIKKDADVVVLARKTSGGATALQVVDRSAVGQLRKDFRGRGPGRLGGPEGVPPTPGSTGSATGTGLSGV